VQSLRLQGSGRLLPGRDKRGRGGTRLRDGPRQAKPLPDDHPYKPNQVTPAIGTSDKAHQGIPAQAAPGDLSFRDQTSHTRSGDTSVRAKLGRTITRDDPIHSVPSLATPTRGTTQFGTAQHSPPRLCPPSRTNTRDESRLSEATDATSRNRTSPAEASDNPRHFRPSLPVARDFPTPTTSCPPWPQAAQGNLRCHLRLKHQHQVGAHIGTVALLHAQERRPLWYRY
jgi:hypothetical protein